MEAFINAVISDGIFEETSKGNYLNNDCHFFYRIKHRTHEDKEGDFIGEYVVSVSDTFSFLAERDNRNGIVTEWTVVFRSGDETVFEAWAAANLADTSTE